MTARQAHTLALCMLTATFVLPGCAHLRHTPAPALPSRNTVVLDQLVVFSNSPLPGHHRLLEDLRGQRTHLSTMLALPVSDEPIHVYLFPTADDLESYMRVHYPALPKRRAFFVEGDTRLSVYAYWGDRVAEDLRHEVAHGYLHALVPHLPLWLDEGLAEYFEVPRGQAGLNRPHIDQLLMAAESGWRPDILRLERLQQTGEMTQTDYAESWLWVHFLLESTPERRHQLQSYLQSLSKSHAAPKLSDPLRAADNRLDEHLYAHLIQLRQSLR